MDNHKELTPGQLLGLWQAGKVSYVEATTYLLQRLVKLSQDAPSHRLECPHCGEPIWFSLTVCPLKPDIDSPLEANHPTKG
jgi:hypothetical protein